MKQSRTIQPSQAQRCRRWVKSLWQLLVVPRWHFSQNRQRPSILLGESSDVQIRQRFILILANMMCSIYIYYINIYYILYNHIWLSSWWFGTTECFLVFIYRECHHPNWRSGHLWASGDGWVEIFTRVSASSHAHKHPSNPLRQGDSMGELTKTAKWDIDFILERFVKRWMNCENVKPQYDCDGWHVVVPRAARARRSRFQLLHFVVHQFLLKSGGWYGAVVRYLCTKGRRSTGLVWHPAWKHGVRTYVL